MFCCDFKTMLSFSYPKNPNFSWIDRQTYIMRNLFYIKYLFLLGFILFFNPLQAQKLLKNLTFDLQATRGFIIESPKITTHLMNSAPYEVQLRIMKQTVGKKSWEKLYKYPRYGVALSYFNYLNPVMGEGLSLMYTGDFTIFKLGKSSINTILGMGVSYLTNPYNRLTNPKNQINGSHWNVGFNVRIGYQQYISQDIKLNIDLGVLHFSNGGSQQPNWSTNHVAIGLGITYFPLAKKSEQLIDTNLYVKNKRWYLDVYASGSWVDQYPTGGKKYPVGTLNFVISRQISRKSLFQVGFDVLYNGLFPNTINGAEIINYSPWRVSWVVGIELPMNKFSSIIQLGTYIYKPQSFDSLFYQRYGWKYAFANNLYAIFAVRTKLGSVDNLEFGLGYKFIKKKGR